MPDCQITRNIFGGAINTRFCKAMKGALADKRTLATSKGRGFAVSRRTDIETGKPSRFLILLRDGDYMKKPIILNYCPFCRADLRAAEMGK